ncbi:hypothetical protein B0H34DRAFT_676805 [Crassisporium funariophilum]|nr:hypothetical protein B0H34DRAFT_676805 [Crassisporium funariophilum]
MWLIKTADGDMPGYWLRNRIGKIGKKGKTEKEKKKMENRQGHHSVLFFYSREYLQHLLLLLRRDHPVPHHPGRASNDYFPSPSVRSAFVFVIRRIVRIRFKGSQSSRPDSEPRVVCGQARRSAAAQWFFCCTPRVHGNRKAYPVLRPVPVPVPRCDRKEGREEGEVVERKTSEKQTGHHHYKGLSNRLKLRGKKLLSPEDIASIGVTKDAEMRVGHETSLSLETDFGLLRQAAGHTLSAPPGVFFHTLCYVTGAEKHGEQTEHARTHAIFLSWTSIRSALGTSDGKGMRGSGTRGRARSGFVRDRGTVNWLRERGPSVARVKPRDMRGRQRVIADY